MIIAATVNLIQWAFGSLDFGRGLTVTRHAVMLQVSTCHVSRFNFQVDASIRLESRGHELQ